MSCAIIEKDEKVYIYLFIYICIAFAIVSESFGIKGLLKVPF